MHRIKLITTTSNIEGWDIEQYYGIVTHQIVIGANLFKDVFASFSDVFGGTSKSYQKELGKMESIALRELKTKAIRKGGNIILGLRLDFDEVSGGGKSMFMISASGTVAKGNPQKAIEVSVDESIIDSELLSFEVNRTKITNKLNSGEFVVDTVNKIAELCKYKIEAVANVVTFIHNDVDYNYKNNKSVFFEYFSSISESSINSFLISPTFLSIKTSAFYKIRQILSEINWFNYDIIKHLLTLNNSEANKRAIYLMDLGKENYNSNDIILLNNIAGLIKKIYSKYPKLVNTKGLLGKEKQKWECPSCKKQNSIEYTYCVHEPCSSNQFGFKKPYIDPIELSNELELQARTLESLLIDK